jgi:TetR/AcrR family transcriptional regulator, regulator of autoinduction and epiphytic fitness
LVEKKRDTSKKRNAILDAAIQGFRDEGYETVSMDRIADIAQASKRTVYNHFESKEALFQAVVERFMEEVSVLKQITYDSKRTLADQLSEFADAKVKAMANPTWQGLLKVAMGVFIRDPELAKRTMSKAEAGQDTFVTWLIAAKKDKKLKFKKPDLTAEIFWSLVSGALFWPQLFHGPMPKRHIKLLKDEIVETFLSRYSEKMGDGH